MEAGSLKPLANKSTIMKRRSFLKSLPLLAVAPLSLSAMPIETHSRHLIALGTAACRLASNHSRHLSFDTVTMINSEKPAQIGERQTFISFQSPDYLFEQVEYLHIPKREYLPVLPLSKEIQSHLQNLTGELVFLAGLGGVTSTLLFQSIGCHYTNLSHRMEWLGMMPFSFEGTRRGNQAQRAVQVLADLCREPTCLYLEEIRKRYGNLSIRSAYQKADEWVLKVLIKDLFDC
jgi:hypothetical protein